MNTLRCCLASPSSFTPKSKVAEEILQKGQATLIFLARAMLDDPYWPLHASFELDSRSEISLPPPYEYVLQNPVIAAHN
jgi:2,4-dienoyl-CoA reductase-like NADH-dependent reductase (Old Yellow Enzyme family)